MLDDANDLRGRLDAAHVIIAQQVAAIAELAAQNANLLHQIMQQQTQRTIKEGNADNVDE